MPKLYMNEGLVNRIIEISPQGMQFLKPITLEVPHFGSLRNRERELLLLRSDPDADFWREHVSTNMSSEGNAYCFIFTSCYFLCLLLIVRLSSYFS